MKKALMLSFVAALLMGCCCKKVQTSETQDGSPVIGIYDSRSIAVAFAGSEAFNKWMADLITEHKTATTAGDKSKIAEIEAEMQERQKLAHKQAFSTAPVDNILSQVQDCLSEIKQDTKTDILVSKWDKETLSKYPSSQLVDVTMEMIEIFNPNQRQRESAIAIQKSKPISLNQAEKITD